MGSKSNISPAQVKEILDAHENTLMKFFNTAIERLERKVDNLATENAVLEKEMMDLKSSMQFHSDTIDEKLLEVDTNVSQVDVVNDESIKTLIDDHKNLHVKVRDLEDRSRRNNLRFDGLSQAQGEDWHGSKANIKKLIKKKLGIENVEIERVHRITKEERNGPSQKRTIIAKFLNYKDKEKVLQEYRSRKLWEEQSSLKHDLHFIKNFMTFEMAPNNSEFDFEQISFKPFKCPDGKIFQDDRDPDINYFD